jgi:prephenate dehydrogenase
MALPKSVTIFGTGLIGGSLALALKRATPSVRISGVDRPEILARARELGMVDADDPQGSQLFILAAPVGQILKLIDGIPQSGAIVTDVGSTKVAICRKAEERGLNFVGGHPMAGSEKNGPEAASADLFKGTHFFLCPMSTTPQSAVRLMQEVVEAIGAVPHLITPEDHDRLVAQISHLPQLISDVLAAHTASNREFAGPGLKSMTRLAASPVHVWRDIFKTSGFLPHEVLSFINRLRDALDALEQDQNE